MKEQTKTRGTKSSELKACYHAFFAGFFLAVYGVMNGSDLSDLGWLIVGVCSPLMWYAGARTTYKVKHGEKEKDAA